MVEASQKIYNSSEDEYKRKFYNFCKKNAINYNGLFLPKEEKHYYCKFCGKEILGKYRSQKQFCNHSCSASYNNIGRTHTEETKIKISHSLQENNPNFDGQYKSVVPLRKNNYIINPKKGKEYYCLNCGKTLSTQNVKHKKYCSHKCQHEYIQKQYIDRWKQGLENGIKNVYDVSKYVRHYLFKKNNNSCECCGWNKVNPYTGKVPLQIK